MKPIDTVSTARNLAEDTSLSPDTSGIATEREDILRGISAKLPLRRQQAITEDPDEIGTSIYVDTGSSTPMKERPVLDLPRFRRLPEYETGSFSPLQEWEGVVIDIGQDSFTARLIDLTAHSSEEGEEADFPLDDLTENDRRLLRRGAIFRWAIGYHRSKGGTKKRVSQIVFRRLPQWTERELSEAAKAAERISRSIRWD